MIAHGEVLNLVESREGDPFAVLGLHAIDTGKLWLRAMLPGARSVAVLDAATGKRTADLSLCDPAGLLRGAKC